MNHRTKKFVFATVWILLVAGCGRAPADPGDPGWPPSQGKSEPRPGTDSKTPGEGAHPPGGGCTVGSMVSVTVIEKLRGERTSTSIVMDGGLVHTSYWRCTVPCYQCQVPLPDPRPPCSDHRFASGLPDEVLFLAESIHKKGGMGTSLWLSPDGLPHASSSGLSDVMVSGRGAGPTWSTAKLPGGYYTSFTRTWADVDNGGRPHVAWLSSSGAQGAYELWHGTRSAKGWEAKKQMSVYPDATAAFDNQGRLHLAHSTTVDVSSSDAQVMLYLSPEQKPWGVLSSTKQGMQVRALELDAKGRAHLLYLSRKRLAVAQWEPTELWYATNASGQWKHSRLSTGHLYPAYFTPGHVALALDPAGQPHVAINGSSWSGSKSNPQVRHPLVAGSLRGGQWRFVQVDSDTTGAVDLAVHTGVVYVSYFGEEDFRVAKVMVY